MDGPWLKSQFDLNPERKQADLARTLGVEPPVISKILAGKRQIKAAEYMAMRRFFGLPVESDKVRPAATPASSSSTYVIEPLATGSKGLAEERQQETTGSPDPWIMPSSLFESRTSAAPEKIKIFQVQENTMAPDFRNGEYVLVDMSDKKPSPAGIFVLSDGLGNTIRRCDYIPHSSPARVKISANDTKAVAYDSPLEDTHIIGRVIAKLQWL